MFKLLKFFSWQRWILIAILLVLLGVQVYCEIQIPVKIGDLVALFDHSIFPQNNESKTIIISTIIYCGILIGILIINAIFSSIIASKFAYEIRLQLFKKVNSMSLAGVNHFTTASLISRNTIDIDTIASQFRDFLRIVLIGPFTIIFSLIMIGNQLALSNFSINIILIVIGITTFLIIFFVSFILLVEKKAKKVDKNLDLINDEISSVLTGAKIIKSFNAQGFHLNNFQHLNKAISNNVRSINFSMCILYSLSYTFIDLINITVYWLGAWVLKTNGVFDDSATLYPSQIIVVATFATLIINAFLRTAGALASLPKSIVSARRVNEVLNYVDPIQDVKQLSKPFTTTGEITFKNVSFTYPNSAIPTLKGISFNVSKGQTLGIIGANGAGKSTIIELMQRFYDCTKGSIAIDGIDVRQIPLKILRNKIGYVSQKVFLFRNTLKNNIYFKETKINETLMKDIADVSHLNDFITTLPHQYDAQISENGVNLSGGQKQRVSIARALAKNPEFLIFDNSFSALDYRTSKSVLKKILIKYKNTTKIITSHRVADIANADLILLIDQGKIVAHGSHRELYQKNKTYQQIVKSQITDQEALLI